MSSLSLTCRLLAKSNRLGTTRNAVWALSNLCRGKNPPPDFAKVRCDESSGAAAVKRVCRVKGKSAV